MSTIDVRIPPGVDTGSSLRLAGEGEAGPLGGPPGDLYVVIHVKPHPHFVREGDDLIYNQKISFAQAALGTDVEVPGLEGRLDLTVPPGVQSGTVLRLKGEGIPHLQRYGRGDELVRIVVETPTSLTKEQRRLFEEMANTFGEDPPKKKKKKGIFR